MHLSANLLLLRVVVVVVAAAHALLLRPVAGACLPRERDDLLAFKDGITGDPSGRLASWRRGEDCCRQWRGVRCSDRTGHVVALQLRDERTGDHSRAGYSQETALVGQVSPSLLSLEHLEHLDLSMNALEGTTGYLPEFLGSLTSLRYLNLSGIRFTGTVPPQLGNLSNLQHLDLSGMQSMHSTDISWLAHLPFLQYLNLNCIDLSTVGDWPHVMNTIPSLRELHLSSCQLQVAYNVTGMLPSWLGNLTGLVIIDLSNNSLTGQIPRLPRSLTTLDFSNNFLSGTLPSNLGAPKLEILILSSNYFTGHIPGSICELQSMVILDLANNLFEGEFPQCFEMRNMTVLRLSKNTFSGIFPSVLQSCTSLAFLDLARNDFVGALPMWIGDFVNLQFLRLSYNMFSGIIPAGISNLSHLYHLNLAGNSLSGSLPQRLSNLTLMTQGMGNDDYYPIGYTLSVVMKGPELYYDETTVDMVSIDLSMNCLTGEIPEEIVSLNALVNLNLSWNRLNGDIPDKIGAMRSLESLDLSKNNLFGEIPLSLSNLTYLSHLDLSYNNLTGRIPSGGQLDTLYRENPSMYSSNSGLCGPPLQMNCSSNNPSSEHDGDQDINEKAYKPILFFYFGLELGFVAGLWVVFCTMLFKKAWVVFYFRLFDKVSDRIYVFTVLAWARLAQKTTTP